MSKKVTKEEFIKRAIRKHGNKYDYSKVEYVNIGTKVCIICHEKDEHGNEHGEFYQTPANHFKKGCMKCGIKSSADAKKISIDDIIKKAKSIHGDKYDYSKLENKKVIEVNTIICREKDENGREHGEFKQSINNHINNKQGCPICAQISRNEKQRSNTEEFIEKSNKKHNFKYDYSKVEYVNNSTPICILCLKHGEFWQTPMSHLSGSGCNDCGNESASLKQRRPESDFIEKAMLKYGNKYDYTKVEYVNLKTKVIIGCPDHGFNPQSPYMHLSSKYGCSKCAIENFGETNRKTTEQFIEEANKIFDFKYDYSDTVYIGAHDPVSIRCIEHGTFMKSPTNHLDKQQGCPKCAGIGSSQEEFIKNIMIEENINHIMNDRATLNGLELDVYIPDKNIAFELNGLYWHSEKFLEDNYHLYKLNKCIEKEIKLFQFFEDEINYKPNIVKSMVLNSMGKTTNKIYARKCQIKEVSYEDSLNFLNENHIQGNCMSGIRYGLYYNEKLISLMTFGKPRLNLSKKNTKEGEYELLRFCNVLNANVIGGASKLLKHFIKINSPKEIISYCDRRLSSGDLYNKLGFEFIHNSKPNYYYVIKDKRENRFKYRKNQLIKDGFDPNKTEKEIMQERGYRRIYDCGTKLFKLII